MAYSSAIDGIKPVYEAVIIRNDPPVAPQRSRPELER